nr:MFS transporter [Parvularcula dongshanensis]
MLGATYGVWLSRIPAVKAQFGLSEGTLGLVLLCFAIGSLLAFPLAGLLADRIGPHRLARLGGGLGSAALVGAGLAPTAEVLAVCLFFMGFAGGLTDIGMNGWGAAIEQQTGRSILSSLHAMFSIGAGAGAISGAIAAWAGAAPSVHFALFGLTGTPVLLFLASAPWAPPAGTETEGPRFALPRPELLLVGLLLFCVSLSEGAMADWGALLTVEVAGARQSEAALAFAVFSATMIAMRLCGDAVIERLGAVTVGRGSALAGAAGVLIAVTADSVPVAYLGFALMGVGYALIFPISIARAARDDRTGAGLAIASVSSFGYAGLLLGPPMIGFLAEATSLPVAFASLLILSLFTLAAASALRPPALRGPAFAP